MGPSDNVKGDLVIEPISGPIIPFVLVSRHRTKDEVAVHEVIAPIPNLGFSTIWEKGGDGLRLVKNLVSVGKALSSGLENACLCQPKV